VTKNESAGRRTYRAATLDAALEAARAELGAGVRVISANKMRRGGIGGFFATEVGVEVICEKAAELSGGPAEVLEHLVRMQRDVIEVSRPVGVAAEPREAVRDWAQIASERVADREPLFEDPLLARAGATRSKSDAEIALERRAAARASEEARLFEEQRIRDVDNAIAAQRRVDARQHNLSEAAVQERERAIAAATERDLERSRSAQLEVERDRAIAQVLDERTTAATEIGRLDAEREAADRRAQSLRVEIERLQREREGMLRRESLLRDTLRHEIVQAETNTGISSNESQGIDVLEKLSLPASILDAVRRGTPLARAIPVGKKTGFPGSEEGLVVLVGPGLLVRELQKQLGASCGVRESDMAYVTSRELVGRENVGVRVLHTDQEIVTWVDGRIDPKKTSILAVEYNAGPSWVGSLRRTSRCIPHGRWRVVLPASYPLSETRTIMTTLEAHNPVIDVVGTATAHGPAGMLAFADRVATVDGEEHSGSLWASLLWERACQL
jgi:hypothetical protein